MNLRRPRGRAEIRNGFRLQHRITISASTTLADAYEKYAPTPIRTRIRNAGANSTFQRTRKFANQANIFRAPSA